MCIRLDFGRSSTFKTTTQENPNRPKSTFGHRAAREVAPSRTPEPHPIRPGLAPCALPQRAAFTTEARVGTPRRCACLSRPFHERFTVSHGPLPGHHRGEPAVRAAERFGGRSTTPTSSALSNRRTGTVSRPRSPVMPPTMPFRLSSCSTSIVRQTSPPAQSSSSTSCQRSKRRLSLPGSAEALPCVNSSSLRSGSGCACAQASAASRSRSLQQAVAVRHRPQRHAPACAADLAPWTRSRRGRDSSSARRSAPCLGCARRSQRPASRRYFRNRPRRRNKS